MLALKCLLFKGEARINIPKAFAEIVSTCILHVILLSKIIPVGIALGYGLDDRGSRVRFLVGGWEFFSSSSRPERLWGPPSLLSNGY
jgi:hypothetical protein